MRVRQAGKKAVRRHRGESPGTARVLGRPVAGKSGETLVEILVSAALFLLMMAVIQGAVSFCTNAQRKSRELRESNARICRNLWEAASQEGQDNGGASLQFRAVSADGTQTGSDVFRVEVDLEKKEIADGARKAVFYFFAPKETAAPGGTGGEGP